MRTTKLLTLIALVGWTAHRSPADPCGMVPPYQLTPGSPELVRVGDQLTYVFFKDGIEDIALRPGFKGKLNDFGMLIPFPSEPEIRKVSDNIFTHIQKAIDPPEIVIDMRPRPELLLKASGALETVDALGLELQGQIKVLKEEAVGMYQVAVLEAENPRALSFWMKANGYIYPEGMDDVCGEYIEEKWCFVAVKANIGSQAQVEPKPGMRKADATADGGFTGAVQAMGFRFRVKEPIVPMRLSAFNEGPLLNKVYYFGTEASRLVELPPAFVKGKLSGKQLYRHMTEPLPVKVLGGTLEQAIDRGFLKMPQYNRDPRPHNGDAFDLFTSDLLAVRQGRLSHPFEEREKELLKIGERLGLRGQEIDKGIQVAISVERSEAAKLVAEDFEGMTLTVIDGNFPRDVIAKVNLTFEAADDVPILSAVGSDLDGTGSDQPKLGSLIVPAILGGVLLLLVGLFAGRGRIRGASMWVIGILCLSVFAAQSDAKEEVSVDGLIAALADPKSSEEAAATLIAQGKSAIPALVKQAKESEDYNTRGWAIVCLADIGDKSAVDSIKSIADDEKAPNMVKSWAGAALLRIRGADAIRDMLREQAKDPSKQEAVAGTILGLRASAVRPLVQLMLTGETIQDRQQATAWLGTLDQRLGGDVVRKVLYEAMRYSDEKAKNGVPWINGPLYLPQYQWTKSEALDVTRQLVCWFIYAEENDQAEIVKQLNNNLRDLSWRNGIGFKQGLNGVGWTREIVKKFGKDVSAIPDGTDRKTLLLVLELLGNA